MIYLFMDEMKDIIYQDLQNAVKYYAEGHW